MTPKFISCSNLSPEFNSHFPPLVESSISIPGFMGTANRTGLELSSLRGVGRPELPAGSSHDQQDPSAPLLLLFRISGRLSIMHLFTAFPLFPVPFPIPMFPPWIPHLSVFSSCLAIQIIIVSNNLSKFALPHSLLRIRL